MYIYQIDRALLHQQVSKAMRYISGDLLNVGSGTYERYDLPTTVTRYVRMDIAAGPNVDVVGRAENIPFSEHAFDSVISTQVFEHVEDPERSAAEVARILKKGGHALITVPQCNELHEEPHDFWRYTKYGLEALFGRHGMKLIAIEPRGGFFALGAQLRMRYLIDRYALHSRPLLGRFANRAFRLWGAWALWRDRRDDSTANRKHTIGWCAVFEKA